jgi:hypothetical protein
MNHETNITANQVALNTIITELLSGHEINTQRFFEAVELTGAIARDLSKQLEDLQTENNRLAWIVLTQSHALTGKFKEHQA